MRPSPLSLVAALALLIAATGSAARGAEPGDVSAEFRLLATARAIVARVASPRARDWIRDRLWTEEDGARYGLHCEEAWETAAAASPDLPLVVLVHGFNSSPQKNSALLRPIRSAGFPTAVFAYPNDWSIERSAALLSESLDDFRDEHEDRTVALVTHSMGGLVARACIENADLDPGNVTRLIMIAPPTHGTLLAHASFGTDLWEHGIARRDGSFWRRWRDSVVDGLGEASYELIPGSPFLTRLNALPRNPRVRYAIFLGTRSPVSPGEIRLVRWSLRRMARAEGWGRYAGSLDNLVADLDEVVAGKGDGVVAVERGRLEGVDDTIALPFDHLFLANAGEEEAVNPVVVQVQSEVLARLR